MKYINCPDCGANLDHGEICDCKKNNGSPDCNQHDPRTSASHSSITQVTEKSKSYSLRDLRVAKKIPAKDMIALVQARYPKYDKTLQSKCERGDEYGIDLRKDALDALYTRYAPELLAAEAHRRQGSHRLTKRIMCRLEDAEYSDLVRCIAEDGYADMNAWLVSVVRTYLAGKRADEYNATKAIINQADYAVRNGLPIFTPKLGICFRCGRNIFDAVKHSDGSVTGFTTRQAKTQHITCCPHCHKSFTD